MKTILILLSLISVCATSIKAEATEWKICEDQVGGFDILVEWPITDSLVIAQNMFNPWRQYKKSKSIDKKMGRQFNGYEIDDQGRRLKSIIAYVDGKNNVWTQNSDNKEFSFNDCNTVLSGVGISFGD